VLVIQPRTEELMQLNSIRWLTIGLVLLLLLINAPLSWSISALFLKPLKKILKSMREVQAGDFDQRVDVKLRDEIGQLAMGYNVMVAKTRDLIQDVYKSELSKKESELRLLQSQINPHFLYNTLNSITWMSVREGAPKTADMVEKLSDFFRHSLSQGADVISLKQELAIVENYLYLSKIRFADKLTYSIEADETAAELRIPKLIVQPIVENAVVHGIEPIDDPGFIHVRVERSDDGLLIEVTDNGIGMLPGKLEELRAFVQSAQPEKKADESGHFALRNVRERLRNHFGADAEMELSSRRGFGTTVKIKVIHRTNP
jgi:two-component system sensor histidine kinase YesM